MVWWNTLRLKSNNPEVRRKALETLDAADPRMHERLVASLRDDDAQVRRALSSILGARGYKVTFASSADEAISDAIGNTPDLIVLDLGLPDRSGLEVCRELRSWTSVPILVLSVRSTEADKIEALDEGADDYLTKPFSAGELLARVRALLRRAAERTMQPACVVAGELVLDIVRRQVSFAGEEIDLLPGGAPVRVEVGPAAFARRGVE